MNYFLVDFENVKSRGLEGIAELGEQDKVVIFYSDNVNTITFDMHYKIMESKAEILMKKVFVGSKNALDFQLASSLGYLIKENEGQDAVYNIVTGDQGFRFLKEFWVSQGERVFIFKNLKSKGTPKVRIKKDKEEVAEQPVVQPVVEPEIVREESMVEEEERILPTARRLEEILPEKGCADKVLEILRSSRTKQEVNSALMKRFPGEKNRRAGRFYKVLKPMLADILK